MSTRISAPILWRAICVLLLLTGMGSPTVHAKWKEVPVKVMIPPTLEIQPGEKILVTMARGTEHWRLNVGSEFSRWLRRELGRNTSLEVLNVEPPPIPEQRVEALASNDVFWRRMATDFKADIIVASLVEFDVEDRSGYYEADTVHPITGQTYRSTQFVERTGFKMRVHILFFQGDNGALLHHDTWSDERILEGQYAEDLHVLFELLDSLKPKLLGIVQPVWLVEPRNIWID